jgi:hypothetical protein
MAIRIRRLGSKVCRVGGPLAGVLLGWTGAGPLHAQMPANLPVVSEQPAAPSTLPAQRNFLNKNHIKLPIQINDADRAALQEVQLYFKENRNAAWVLRDKVAPTQKAFTIQLPRDGEYAFTMVTVNKKGQRDPEDLRNEPAGLVVVIDTQAPQIELANLGQIPEGQLIQFDARDANLDNGRVRFAFQGGDRVFRPLEPLPGRSNVYCIPAQAVFTGLIRVSAEDLAGNATVMEEHLSKIPARSAVVQSGATAPLPVGPANPPQLVQASAQDAQPTQILDVPNSLPPGVSIAPLMPVIEQNPVNARPTGAECRLVEHTVPTKVQPAAHTAPAKRQIVNNPKLFLDYQLENVGPSGVGKLQLWITRDQSRTWTKLSETIHQGSPVEVHLPGEGVFGVTLVAVNGRGVAGAVPAAGDTPDWWIEVDTTKPTVEISKIVAVPENGQHVVHIHWTAQDKNIGDGPVELLYSATPQGPWLPIAKGLKAESQHRWTPPAEIGPQAFVRLIVRDVAGNTTVVNTLEPVLIGDQARPRVVIRGISTNAPVVPVQAVTPRGN